MKYDLSKFFAAVDAEKEKRERQEIEDDFHEERDADFPVQDFPEEQPDDALDAPVTISQADEQEGDAQPVSLQPEAVLQNSDAGEPDRIRALYLAELKPFIKSDLSKLSFMRLEYMRARIITGNQNAKILAAAFDREAERTGSTSAAWSALFS